MSPCVRTILLFDPGFFPLCRILSAFYTHARVKYLQFPRSLMSLLFAILREKYQKKKKKSQYTCSKYMRLIYQFKDFQERVREIFNEERYICARVFERICSLIFANGNSTNGKHIIQRLAVRTRRKSGERARLRAIPKFSSPR